MNINELRKEIDAIDDELVRLFERRMNVAAEIAEYKKENGLPVSDKERERQVINKVTSKVAPDFSEYVRGLYQTIFDVSCSYQRSLNSHKTQLNEKSDCEEFTCLGSYTEE